MRRMDRYEEYDKTSGTSRSNKNQELYQNIGTNTRYTNFTDVTNANAIDLSKEETNSNTTTREGYHKMKEYQNVIPVPKVKKELDEFNHLYHDQEKKVYDINNVLEEARKNRQEKDELEAKRKLNNTSYNILASLNPEELEKYRREKKERVERGNTNKEHELRSLIDTITSKTLAGEIDQATSVDLLSDLMATSVMDKVEKPIPEPPKEKDLDYDDEDFDDDDEIDDDSDYDKISLSKDILDKDQLKEITKEKDKVVENDALTGADTDFYTKSMDLSDKDFEMDDEFKEHKMPLILKLILILLVLAVLVAAGYFIYKNM